MFFHIRKASNINEIGRAQKRQPHKIYTQFQIQQSSLRLCIWTSKDMECHLKDLKGFCKGLFAKFKTAIINFKNYNDKIDFMLRTIFIHKFILAEIKLNYKTL